MMEESKSGMSWIGVLFVILVIWAIFGGGFGNWGNNRFNDNCNTGCGRVSNCEVEKREIIDSARTQYLIEQQGAATRTTVADGTATLKEQNSRIYEQRLQETIFDLKMENQNLKSNIFTKEQTDAIAKQLSECCCEFNRRLDSVECNMLTKPNLSGVASTCSGQIVPGNGFGWNGWGGWNSWNGWNGWSGRCGDCCNRNI